MRIWSHTHFWIPCLLVLSLSYFSFFHQLGKQPMHMWDESSYALNAQEMLESGNPIEVELLGEPDIYNSKPPFAIWCMTLGIKLFGFNELGARVASAFFGMLSCLVLFVVGMRIFKNGWLALLLPMVLASSNAFVGEHIARTGDTDSILAFWILLQSVLVWGYTEASSSKESNLYILGAGLAFTLGCFTKGIGGLTALPGIIAWLIYSRKLVGLVRMPAFYISLLVFILWVPGYYVWRSYLTPGYWNAVVNFEFGGRLFQQEYLNPIHRPFHYFYKVMFSEERLQLWIFLLPISAIWILWSKPTMQRKAGMAFLMMLAGVSLSLASSQTKLFWYDAPLYPLIAAVIGIAAGMFLQSMDTKAIWVFIGMFCWPYVSVMQKNIFPPPGSHVGQFMMQLRHSAHASDSILIINADPNFVLQFYAKQDSLNGYFSRVVRTNDTLLQPGKHILTEKYAREVDVNKLFILDTLLRYEECSYYRIIDKR